MPESRKVQSAATKAACANRAVRRASWQVLKVELEWLETGKGSMELPLDGYDLSNTLPPANVAEPAQRAGRKRARKRHGPFRIFLRRTSTR